MIKKRSKEQDIIGEYGTQDALNDAGYYSISQVAELLGFTDRQIFRYIREKKITSKFARAWRSRTYRVIPMEEIDLLVEIKGNHHNVTEGIWDEFYNRRNS